MPFQKGHPPHKTGGRKKGSLNSKTIEAKEICLEMIHNKSYQKTLLKRLIDGTAGPIESQVWHYAFGKPKEHLDIVLNLEGFTSEELDQFERFIRRSGSAA